MKGKIFTAQEVQAILNGSKVMFREVCKKQPQGGMEKPYVIRDMGIGAFHYPFGKPPYKVGQEIFVKEAFWQFGGYDSGYDSDEPKFIGSDKITFSEEEAAKPQTLCKGWKKRPAQHMKQEHSRLTLRIKSVKVERLQEISEEDCLGEGIEFEEGDNPSAHYESQTDNLGVSFFNYETKTFDITDPIFSFKTLWNSTHKKPEEKWEANPWVFAYEYEVVR